MAFADDRVRRASRTAARGLLGAGKECAWITAHLALYPVGLINERRADDDRLRLDDLPPHRRGLFISDVEAAGTPILLVHGMADNRSIFTRLRRSLRRRGFGRVRTVNYSPLTSDVRTAAAELGRQVETLCAQTGYGRVHVVAHSLGGLIARYYVQRLGGDERVHTLVTLGSPHGGTLVARLLPIRLCRQLRPGSDLIAELAEPAPGCATRFVAVWSDLDQLIMPRQNAAIEHPDLVTRNVPLPGIGHMSLPIDGSVVHEVVCTLAHLDVDGSTQDRPADAGCDSVAQANQQRSAAVSARRGSPVQPLG